MPPKRPKRPETKENIEPGSGVRDIVLQPECLEDLQYWVARDWRTARRILDLIAEVMRTPFQGTGKPEHLKHLGANVWWGRINQTDRLVYLVRDNRIDFLQARYHYGRE